MEHEAWSMEHGAWGVGHGAWGSFLAPFVPLFAQGTGHRAWRSKVRIRLFNG
jgi:hypothetical protein